MTGEVLARLNTDTVLVLAIVSSSVSFALRNFFILVGGLVLMLVTSPKLTLLALLVVPVVVVPILVFGRRLREVSRGKPGFTRRGIGERVGNAAFNMDCAIEHAGSRAAG